ncbi:UvrD-helicase domain-containing protein [Serratia ficaria]|uniref:DNA 3'-5' helicase n=1 Tax=Serratia ficaria TaxID=61651 RepID=A0A240AMN1_SERFI|nr:UvrD-helicase domain-containing protein [Serratia ficaria]REF41984.1 AAA domain-containing protein [Serratia ficaria]CAI0944300.1 ATP-dependent DNA helicase pcrA [Serratia ficaria]CAI0960137.1 ATP-dependent DNA helicase pcrA [Serratia ficaria]CAI1036977.1 ATP-dependent DNA helicase pcrA [Serratia ficaria]CAI2064214.1 ATP-dependent DNA helicase pcrA [Serratia ficaria]
MSYCDTPEQAAIIGWSGRKLVVRAFAGTGKTSTLVRFALANPNSRMLYLAYNRAVRDEAEQKFPFNVECKTSHQLAWPNFGRHYQQRLTGNLRITDVARQLNTRHWPLARVATITLNAFLCSADTQFGTQHLPDENVRSGLSSEKILAAAQLLWRESARQDGVFPVTHDVYLKLYQLSEPDLAKRWQTVLFDEGQDANPVTQALVLSQRCNVVMVGDRHQQIYRFRGAENALDAEQLADAQQLCLTHSFRFGPGVARVANMLLKRQGETLPLVGNGGEDNVVTSLPEQDKSTHIAVLSRTVAGVIGRALEASLAGKKVYWVGGIAGYKTEELEDLYWFSADMPERMQSPLLAREYRNFEEFESVARATKDAEMNQGLRLLDQYFPLPQKLQVMREHAVTDESQAQVTVSTAHRSKGLEWPVVMLNDDFADITDPLMVDSERTDEANLLYVAVTRAQQTLVLNDLLQVLMDGEGDIAGGPAC